MARELAAQLTPPGDFGQEIISGQAGNADDAAQRIYQTIEALNTFGFFGGEKLVWLKDVNFLQTTAPAARRQRSMRSESSPTSSSAGCRRARA